MGQLADGSVVAFSTRSGVLHAFRNGDQFATRFSSHGGKRRRNRPSGLIESLNIQPLHVGKSRFDYLVEVASESVVRGLSPDFKKLITVNCRGVIVTSRSDDPRFDFVSRFFAPVCRNRRRSGDGIRPLLSGRLLGSRLGKAAMVGYQASARGGVVHVEIRGNRVMLGGEAVIVAQGELLVA